MWHNLSLFSAADLRSDSSFINEIEVVPSCIGGVKISCTFICDIRTGSFSKYDSRADGLFFHV